MASRGYGAHPAVMVWVFVPGNFVSRKNTRWYSMASPALRLPRGELSRNPHLGLMLQVTWCVFPNMATMQPHFYSTRKTLWQCFAGVSGLLLRLLGYYWGVLGVIGIIGSAAFKLFPRIVELNAYPFAIQHWLVLAIFTPYMAYAEGYKGFYLNLAPRVLARALYLREAGSPLLALAAPLFCMGYFYATRRRMLTSWIVSLSIVLLVAIVSHIPQPWRGLIDVGVEVGLVVGIAAILWHWLRFEFARIRPQVPPDLPVRVSEQT